MNARVFSPMVVLALTACRSELSVETPDMSGTSLYALVETVDGTAFYPPLGPEPTPTGTFDPTLLAQLHVRLEATDGAGQTRALATFDASTSPALQLLMAHEVYFVNVPAATYITDPALSYRFRVLLADREIGRSDLSDHVFTVLRYVPNVPIGVKIRAEVRPAPTVTALSASCIPHGEPLSLTISGGGFARDSVVRFGGVAVPTTRLTSASLVADVPAGLAGTASRYDVEVVTPAPGGGVAAMALDDHLVGATCDTGLLGLCGVGATTCASGAIACAQTVTASTESCDGLDNDCDGEIDEGCPCVHGTTRSCYSGPEGTLGVGACLAGVQACLFGQWGTCAGEVTPTAELCDGADDDCNGATDDLAPLTCGRGACERTVAACAGGRENTCTPGQATAELCNGLDDDCDGVVDNGTLAGQACGTGLLGACATGVYTCIADGPSCQAAQATAEICDGVDNDCNGQVDDGVCIAPPRIAAGSMSSCVVMPDTSVRCWGDNDYSELGTGTTPYFAALGGFPLPNFPVYSLTGAAAVASGSTYNCALMTDHSVRCWGYNSTLTIGMGYPRTDVNIMPGLVASEISAGPNHVCVRRTTGAVACWGQNTYGQIGDGTTSLRYNPYNVPGLSSAISVSTGANHTCAALADGTVWCWGANTSGQLGNGTTAQSLTPVAVTGINDATQVAVSVNSSHSCALLRSGAVKCWGDNTWGQVGIGSLATPQLVPVAVNGLSNVAAISAGDQHTCALLADHSVRCWGSDATYQLGNDTSDDRSAIPVSPVGLSNVVSISAGTSHTCALLADNTARCWGSGANLATGDGTTLDRPRPNPVAGIPCVTNNAGVCVTTCMPTTCVAQGATSGTIPDGCGGTLFCGRTSYAHEIAVGESSTCARRNDGTVRCWGSNSTGQLGDGTATQRRTPVTVLGISASRAVTVGYRHACALQNDGTVKCWGLGTNGNLGDGTTTSNRNAQTVLGVSNAVAISAGIDTTCAFLADRTIKCWGNAANGMCGDGNGGIRSTPVSVMSLRDPIQVESSGAYACALQSNGYIQCWGTADSVSLSNHRASTALPFWVPGIRDAVHLVPGKAGGNTMCAILANGSSTCWGNNTYGQTGGGTVTTAIVGPLASTLSGFTNFTVGQSQTCGLRSDGAVQCWGLNASGQLGDGTTIQRASPVSVALPGPASEISTAYLHTCAKLVDGSAYCWGANTQGQLGDNTIMQRNAPAAVTGL